jgi:hypothetical protein
MYGLLSRKTFSGILLLFCVPWVLVGCGDFDRTFGGGGTDNSGSILNVEEVIPTYFDEATNQVDVVQDNCAAPGDDPDPEPFTDHFAEIAMTNRPLNNAEEQTASWVYLSGYQIHYTPVTQGSPLLPSSNVIPISESVGLEPCLPAGACTEESFVAEMVPVREKGELYQFLLDNPTVFQLQYNVHYVVFGENDFGEPVSADGFTNFYATNYDNCGG